MKVLLIITICFTCNSPAAFSQTNKMNNHSGLIKLSGTVLSGKNDVGKKDTAKVVLYPYYTRFRPARDAIKITTEMVNGEFSCQLPKISKPYYISVFLPSQSTTNKKLSFFLIEPGDSIYLLILKDSIIFSGKGSEKFICQYEIQHIPEISFSKDELIHFFGKMAGYEFNIYRKTKMDSLNNLKLQVLERHKKELKKSVYQRLIVDYSADELFQLYNSLELHLHIKSDSVLRNEQIKFFNELNVSGMPAIVSEETLLESKSYLDYLMIKSLTSILVKKYTSGVTDLYSYSLGELFNYFRENFNDKIYERLTDLSIQLFYKPIDDTQNKYMDEALRVSKNPYFKKNLLAIQKIRTSGSAAYPFKLTDKEGNEIRLTDFAGKVLIMDFWFTGCSSCISLEKEMKGIRERLKNDTSIVFLSVCLDKDKVRWLKSVESGLYTDTEAINVYTNGLGFEDPLIRNYQIAGCPEVIIIDPNQKNFNTKPLLPNSPSSAQTFFNLILKAKK